jgi:hypothetical protein
MLEEAEPKSSLLEMGDNANKSDAKKAVVLTASTAGERELVEFHERACERGFLFGFLMSWWRYPWVNGVYGMNRKDGLCICKRLLSSPCFWYGIRWMGREW